MDEIAFQVVDAPEGGYTARSLGPSIFVEADTFAALREAVRDGVRCHFDDDCGPTRIRLRYVREEVMLAR